MFGACAQVDRRIYITLSGQVNSKIVNLAACELSIFQLVSVAGTPFGPHPVAALMPSTRSKALLMGWSIFFY